MSWFRSGLMMMCGLLLAACASLAPPREASEDRLMRLNYISQADQQSRDAFVYLPRGYDDQPHKRWPVLLFLHGNGERGNGRDELPFVMSHGPLYEAWIRKNPLPFVIIAPQLQMFGMEKVPYIARRKPENMPARQPDTVPPYAPLFASSRTIQAGETVTDMSQVPQLLPRGWEEVETDLVQLLDKAARQYRIDEQRITLTGLSYGGFGTWYLASKHPERFAAIVPVVGWGHPDLIPPIAAAGVPVWAFAGGRDSTIAKKYFYPGIDKLRRESQAEIRFTVHEEMEHDAWKRVYASRDLYDWLLSQHRKR